MFLDKHNPIYLIKQELDKSIVGYDKEKLMVFCLAMSYKLEKSSGVILVGPSSGGKSNILNNVMHYFPVESDIEKARKKKCGIMCTGLSKKVLNYFVPPGNTWNHKILGIQELDGSVEAAAVIRTLLSEGKASTLVTEESEGRHYAASFNVNGFPALFVTTANDTSESQFGNRLNVIEVPGNIVSSVLEYEARRYANGAAKKINYDEHLTAEIEKIQEEADVLIPYSMNISKIWYTDTVVAQRSFPEFLKLIQCICIIHGKNRKRLNGVLVANLDDYEIARRIVKISKYKLGAGLLRAYKLIVSALLSNDEKYIHPLKDGRTIRAVTREQLSELVERSMPQIDRYLEELCDKGILKTHMRYVEEDRKSVLRLGRNPNVYSLALKTEEDILFPSPRQLLHTDADLKKMRFKQVGEYWELSQNDGVPCTFHAYDPLTGKDININEDETIYMVERKEKGKQSELEKYG